MGKSKTARLIHPSNRKLKKRNLGIRDVLAHTQRTFLGTMMVAIYHFTYLSANRQCAVKNSGVSCEKVHKLLFSPGTR